MQNCGINQGRLFNVIVLYDIQYIRYINIKTMNQSYQLKKFNLYVKYVKFINLSVIILILFI